MSRKRFCSQLHFLPPIVLLSYVPYILHLNSFSTHEPHTARTVLHSSVFVSENTKCVRQETIFILSFTLMYLTLQGDYFTVNHF